MAAHFSPIMIEGALVLPAMILGMIEASEPGDGPPMCGAWAD